MNKYIVKLEISSFAGYSFGATHCYGKIAYYNSKDKFIIKEIKKKLNKEDCDKLNIKYKEIYYEVGNTTERFNSEKEVIDTTIKYVKKYLPSTKLILQGIIGVGSVEKAVYGDKDKVNKINELYKKADSISFYDNPKNNIIMERIDNEFEKILEGL